MSDNSPKTWQKVVVIVSGLALLGVMVFPMMGSLNQSSSSNQQTTANADGSPEERLKAIAQGYEKVLEREPNNPTALQGLVEARLQLRDLEGAIAPMEKLVSLYPEQEQLGTILKTMKEQLELQKNPPPQPSPDTNQDNNQN